MKIILAIASVSVLAGVGAGVAVLATSGSDGPDLANCKAHMYEVAEAAMAHDYTPEAITASARKACADVDSATFAQLKAEVLVGIGGSTLLANLR